MSEFHIAFNDDELDIDLDVEDVDAETDTAVLCDWYSRAEELIDEIRDDIEFKRSIDRASDDWLWRCGRKIAYLRKAIRRIEQRILKLGGMPPYRLNDGRANHIRNLEKKLAQAKEAMLSNGVSLPWEKAA